MTARILAPLFAAGLLISTSAFASIPYITQCQLYMDDLDYAVSEIHFHNGTPDFVIAAKQQARTSCSMGDAAEGVEVLKAAITQLGVPLRDHSN